MNSQRGHETTAHRRMKTAIWQQFRNPRWAVFVEYRGCDLWIVDTRSAFRLAVEVERSTRNLARNARRNWAAGCDALAIVEGRKGEAARLNRAVGRLPSRWQPRIRVFSLTPPNIAGLRSWAETLAAIKADPGTFFCFPASSTEGATNHNHQNPPPR